MKYKSIISGTGSYLPEKVLTNDDLSKIVDTSDEWIVQRVGIKKRHIAAAKSEVTSVSAAICRASCFKQHRRCFIFMVNLIL